MKIFYSIAFVFLLTACSVNNSNADSGNQASDSGKTLTEETLTLYNNLKTIATDHILFGHQDDLAYGIDWWGGEFVSDIYKVSGDFPAVFGWDLGHIDSTENIDNVPFNDIRNWIIDVYERGGINTIGWHQRNLASKGSSWDTTKVVARMLPGGDLNEEFNSQLDKVAAFLGSCVTEEGVKVPILLRPYHEHNGGWFWWGKSSCPDEQYKELWKYTHNYLRNIKETDNILFIYSTDEFFGKEDYLSRYPGDEYVDIFGWDDYKSIRKPEQRERFHEQMEIVNSLAKEKDKVACLAETGYETLSYHTWWTDVLLDGLKSSPNTDCIAYLLVWRNARRDHHYAPYPGHPSVESFLEFKNDSSTLFLSDLPNMYKKN